MFAPRNLMFKGVAGDPPGDPSSGYVPSAIGLLQLAPAFEVSSTSNVHVCALSTHAAPTAHPCTASLKATSETPMMGRLLGVGVGPGVPQDLPKTACGQRAGVLIGTAVALGFAALGFAA